MEDDLVRGDNIANPRDSSQLLEVEESSAESPSNRNMAARQNETDTQTHDQEDAIENSGYGRRPRKKVSKVWDDFEEYKVGGILIGIKCKHCKHVFKASKSGTTTQFKRHLQTCPRRSFVISGQPQLSLQVGSSTGNNLQPWKYDHSRIRELMSHMVMVHELLFKFAEYEVFNMLMKESYPEFRKVSRTTLKNDCIVSYNNEKKRLIALLNSVKRVSITTDIW
uniref:BED-type domain-containing protein n=1 Tax=Kalanchoe fedtschenkoi TaxID=63787 RepID=A0A7N0VG81_KALFE